MSAPVVVSAGEPVAYQVLRDGEQEDICPSGARAREVVEVMAREDEGRGVSCQWQVVPLHAAAPVVLPEEPPANLIEKMARAAFDPEVPDGPLWRSVPKCERDAYLVEARAGYSALCAWVAGGGETR